MMKLALLAIAAVQVPATQAEVVFLLETRYEARTEAGGPLRINTQPTTFRIDSTRAIGPARRVYSRTMQVDADRLGFAIRMSQVARPGLDSAQVAQFRQDQLLIGGGAGVLFPEERLARVYRVLPATRLRAGERWSEPVEWQAERHGVGATQRGVRTSTVVRDTLIDGRVHWIVRDSTALQRDERWPEHSYSLISDVAHESQSTGTLMGTWVYDPARAIAVARADTLRLERTVTRKLPFGRVIAARSVMTRYEQWTALAAQQYQQWSDAQAAERRRLQGGMFHVPSTPVEERIAQGDTTVLDSLVAVWRVADVDARFQVERQLLMWRGDVRTVHRRMKSAALEVGDTLAAFSQVVRRMSSYSPPFDRDELLFVLGYLEDPQRALRNGIRVDAAFDAMFYTLMRTSPALARDTATQCRENACELLEQYADRTDVDPRLRDLAVIARYYENPRDGFAELEARVPTGTAMVQRVHHQALGYPNEWGRPGRGGPFPALEAEWSEWATWLESISIFEPGLFRLYSTRTGRDFRREFEAGYRSAQTDTARFVYGILLTGVDPSALGTEEIAQLLTSTSPTINRLGERALGRVYREAKSAPDELAVPLLNDMIAMLLENRAPSWLNSGREHRGQSVSPSFLISDSLPNAVRERWRDRTSLISRAEWNTRDRRLEGGSYMLRATSTGLFVVLRYHYDGRLAREPDAAPYLYAAGAEWVLLRTEDGWRVVSNSSWIT